MRKLAGYRGAFVAAVVGAFLLANPTPALAAAPVAHVGVSPDHWRSPWLHTKHGITIVWVVTMLSLDPRDSCHVRIALWRKSGHRIGYGVYNTDGRDGQITWHGKGTVQVRTALRGSAPDVTCLYVLSIYRSPLVFT